MGVTNYTVLDGEIISEDREGVARDYIPDPLGSTVAMLDSNQTRTATASYWPYGELRTSTGNPLTPFLYVGTLGYRKQASGTYVRARELEEVYGRWMTVDPLWPTVQPFTYALASPARWTDPNGMQVAPGLPWHPTPGPGLQPTPPPMPISCTPAWNEFVFQYCQWCGSQSFTGVCQGMCDYYAGSYYSSCGNKPRRKPRPGEHWGLTSAPGRGVIAPSAPPRPQGPCWTSWPGPDEDCISGSFAINPDDPSFNLLSCLGCCETSRQSNVDACKSTCRGTFATLAWGWFNRLSPITDPKPGPGYR